MEKEPRITREILYRNSRYNYLTVDDYGKAILHYVEPVKVNSEWVHLGKTYGESIVLELDGIYNNIDSDKIIKRYYLHDYTYGGIWIDTSNSLLCIIKDSVVEYDIYDGFNVSYIGRTSEDFLTIEYMQLHLEKPDILEKIINGVCWVDWFGIDYNILHVSYTSNDRIISVTIANGDGDRIVIGIYEFLRDYSVKYNDNNDIEVVETENSYCCKDCVIVGDIYILGNEAHRVTGIGSGQSVSLFNGYDSTKSIVTYLDFKRRYEKFDYRKIKSGSKWVSVYGGKDTYTITSVNLKENTVMLECDGISKTRRQVKHDMLTLLSRYKPYKV